MEKEIYCQECFWNIWIPIYGGWTMNEVTPMFPGEKVCKDKFLSPKLIVLCLLIILVSLRSTSTIPYFFYVNVKLSLDFVSPRGP